MWREGLLIQLSQMGIGGRMYNWIMNCLTDRKIRVKIGADSSTDLKVENRTPQGSTISPVLFNIMINSIFSNLGCIKSALYAADGAIWMRGRNISHVIGNIKKSNK